MEVYGGKIITSSERREKPMIIYMRIIIAIISVAFLSSCNAQKAITTFSRMHDEVKEILRKQVMDKAAWALQQQPITVTAQSSLRSAGGKHDFYSEGDYWWPNPVSVDSPYIQRDGMTNP